MDKNLQLVRDELVQSYVWVQARNDALRYMKEHLKAQLIEERQIVSTYQEQLRDLEDQSYSIGLLLFKPKNATFTSFCYKFHPIF